MRRSHSYALLCTGLIGFFCLFARGHLESGDSLASMQGARAWWLRGNPGLMTKAQADAAPATTPTWALEHYLAGIINDPNNPTYGRKGVGDRAYVWFPIGHQALFVPCVALGDAVEEVWPEPARASERALGEVFGVQFWPQFFASFLSPLAGAGMFVVLLLLACTLGASRRDALIATFVATICTQFWPGTTETMSNAPGTFFLFLTAWLVARYAAGSRASILAVAGFVAGAGVLIRYPQATAVLVLGAWVLYAAYRRGRLVHIVWFALGGLPWALVLLGLNDLRFDDPFETGYSNSAGFGLMPIHQGLFLIACAWGKGVLWFTPLLFVVIPLAFTRAARGAPTTAALAIFGITLAMYSSVVYWAAGQCWGIRYMTAPITLLSVIVLAKTTPWRRWPRRFVALAALGAVFTLGGILTSYPGHQHYAFVAAPKTFGANLPNIDNNINHWLRGTPIVGHWIYASLSASGRIDEGGAENTVEPLFGVDMGDDVVPQAPVNHRGFRHFWWRWLGHLAPDFPVFWVVLAWIAGAAACLWLGLRSWLGADRPASA